MRHGSGVQVQMHLIFYVDGKSTVFFFLFIIALLGFHNPLQSLRLILKELYLRCIWGWTLSFLSFYSCFNFHCFPSPLQCCVQMTETAAVLMLAKTYMSLNSVLCSLKPGNFLKNLLTVKNFILFKEGFQNKEVLHFQKWLGWIDEMF